jgi:5-methylcytosine-specific restriction endonuclease McrA
VKRHIKNYFKAHGYTTADIILCEVCSAVGVDIHHIVFKSHGGSDEVSNLVALCRDCHSKAHSDKQFNESLKNEEDKRNSRF